MNPKLLIPFFCGLYLLTYAQLAAHAPNDITYTINLTEGSGEVTLYLTPKTIIDLLVHHDSTLQDSAFIPINKSTGKLESYFNETVEVILDQKRISMAYKASDLMKHDATFTLTINDYQGIPDTVTIASNAFREVYFNSRHHVIISADQQTHHCKLNESNSYCGVRITTAAPGSNRYLVIMITTIALLLFVFTFGLARSRR